MSSFILRPYSDDVVSYVLPNGKKVEHYDQPMGFIIHLRGGQEIMVDLEFKNGRWETELDLPPGTNVEELPHG